MSERDEAIDELSGRVLRDSKAIAKADELVRELHDYMVAFVKHGPWKTEPHASRLVELMHDYRELRAGR